MSRERFTITPTGVGRRDYSQSAEYSVAPIIRSPQRRHVWTDRETLTTLPYPYISKAYILAFIDGSGNVVNYVPDDVGYQIYDIHVGGNRNSLTSCSLGKYAWPTYAYIESVVGIYGYGEAVVEFTKGHKCEPGVVYIVLAGQWSEKPTYTISYTVLGMADEIIFGGA